MTALDVTTLIFSALGALAFGSVMGWVTYRTLRNSTVNGISDIAAVIGAVAGAAITTLFPQGTLVFGTYCIGLAAGFFLYLRSAIQIAEKHGTAEAKRIEWLGSDPAKAENRVRTPGRSMPPDA
jgi:hypothetical protein